MKYCPYIATCERERSSVVLYRSIFEIGISNKIFYDKISPILRWVTRSFTKCYYPLGSASSFMVLNWKLGILNTVFTFWIWYSAICVSLINKNSLWVSIKAISFALSWNQTNFHLSISNINSNKNVVTEPKWLKKCFTVYFGQNSVIVLVWPILLTPCRPRTKN